MSSITRRNCRERNSRVTLSSDMTNPVANTGNIVPPAPLRRGFFSGAQLPVSPLLAGRLGADHRSRLTQGQEVGLVQRFVFEQQAGTAFEHLALRPQEVDRPPERPIDDRFDRTVDFPRGRFAITALGS